MRAWTALRVVAGVGGARRRTGLESPFVGREAELRHVIAEWETTVSTGSARIVRLTGEAGTGKSRLLWEFYKHVDGLETPVWYHQGRCLSYGEGVGYWALAEMVRSRAGIAEEEAPATARLKLRETVEGIVADERERRLVEPRLAHLLGLEERVAPDRADLFSGWRLFFERLAATGPVTFVFEDLQWADTGLLDFIDYLLEWSAEFPIFVLALARPQISDVRPGWRADIALAPLPDAAMREALDALVPGLPDELSARILERAEGVPLYAWRSCACCSTAGCSSSAARATSSPATSATSTCPRRCTRSSPRASTASTRPSAGPCRSPPSSASRSCPPRWPRSGATPRRRRARSSTASWPSRCSPSRTTRCHPSAASTASCRACCAPSPTGRSRAATARRGTWPPPATCRRR